MKTTKKTLEKKDEPKKPKQQKMRRKGKLTLLFLFVVVALSVTAYAAVTVATIPVTITVQEPFSVSSVPWEINAYPGEEICTSFFVTNSAPHTLHAQVNFVPIENPSGITWTTAMPITDPITAYEEHEFKPCITINEDSPTGILTGQLTVERVAV